MTLLIEGAAARKAAGIEKLKAIKKGTDQQHPKEGNAIRLFKEFIDTVAPENGWEFKYPFDCLQPDLLVRHSSWKMNEYIMIQVKSVGIQFGVSAHYYHGESEKVLYDNFIYCIGIGIRGYHYVEKPSTINDVVVDGSTIYDIIYVGCHVGGVTYQPAI